MQLLGGVCLLAAASAWALFPIESTRAAEAGGSAPATAKAPMSVWGRNILDEDSATWASTNAALTVGAGYERARTYGVDFSYKY